MDTGRVQSGYNLIADWILAKYSLDTDYTQAASTLTEHAMCVLEWAGDLGLSLSGLCPQIVSHPLYI